MKLEVVVVPVSDVERAKRFYASLGWRIDADFAFEDSWHVLQVTPTGSACSFFFGKGLTKAPPGSVKDCCSWSTTSRLRELRSSERASTSAKRSISKATACISAARRDACRARSAASLVFHVASFNDPDGNEWVFQEIRRASRTRLSSMDIPTLAPLLRETEEHHGKYEASAPKHHWSDWYAAYLVARERGRTPEEAERDAAQHMGSRQ
jgi:catechol 2,3-dioxygenase-like lactoylglutathione lyase family enzyme